MDGRRMMAASGAISAAAVVGVTALVVMSNAAVLADSPGRPLGFAAIDVPAPVASTSPGPAPSPPAAMPPVVTSPPPAGQDVAAPTRRPSQPRSAAGVAIASPVQVDAIGGEFVREPLQTVPAPGAAIVAEAPVEDLREDITEVAPQSAPQVAEAPAAVLVDVPVLVEHPAAVPVAAIAARREAAPAAGEMPDVPAVPTAPLDLGPIADGIAPEAPRDEPGSESVPEIPFLPDGSENHEPPVTEGGD